MKGRVNWKFLTIKEITLVDGKGRSKEKKVISIKGRKTTKDGSYEEL